MVAFRARRISRRRFLGRSAAGLAALAAPGVLAGGPVRRLPRPQAVVIVRFGGGVRFSEMWTPSGIENIPFLARLAREGAFFPMMYNRGRLDGVAGTIHILTGAYRWPDGVRRPVLPTLFEYARKDFGWSAEDALVISHLRDVTFATFSRHPEYGARFGAARISPEMVLIERLFRQLRDPDVDRRQRLSLEAALRPRLAQEQRAHDLDPLPGQTSARLGRFVRSLSEGRPPTDFQTYGDDEATWFAMEALDQVAPRALFLPLGSTNRAETGRWSAYIEAIRRCDWLTGKLYAALQAQARYRDRTLFVVVPDHGRCGDGYGSAGFQYADGADESAKHISCVMVGPGVRGGAVIERRTEQIDILPTIAELMGFAAPHAEGQTLKEALG